MNAESHDDGKKSALPNERKNELFNERKVRLDDRRESSQLPVLEVYPT